MDIIDVSAMGVQTAVLELRSRGSSCRFTIYPMLHLGEASFYRAVAARDMRDVLLCEAVTRIHSERCEEDIDVAVVYGAEHVAPLVAHLRSRHGYIVRSAEWLQVFSL